MEEVWKPVVGYEGKYEVSSKGRVASLNYGNSGKRGLLVPVVTHGGYLRVSLSSDKTALTKRVHRLVSEAFIPNPENFPQVNHIDEDKHNNSMDNLEWCSARHNNLHNGRAKLVGIKNSKKVEAFDSKGKFAYKFDSLREAGEAGYNMGCISMCCNGTRITHRGLTWKYTDSEDSTYGA